MYFNIFFSELCDALKMYDYTWFMKNRVNDKNIKHKLLSESREFKYDAKLIFVTSEKSIH